MLLDASGDDRYSARDVGTNGGSVLGVGFLLDGGGGDTYAAHDQGTNGGTGGGASFLLDLGGGDSYTAFDRGTNGGAELGVGFLLDVSGNDIYRSTGAADVWGAANGGVTLGVGVLIDLQGSDRYFAANCGTNGGTNTCIANFAALGRFGIGLLLDAAGADYDQDSVVQCWDCTLLPKGSLGAQLDVGQPLAAAVRAPGSGGS